MKTEGTHWQGQPEPTTRHRRKGATMNSKKILAAALAVFTVLTLAVSSASADGGGDPCKKRPCPPPPCKVDCPNPEPTEPPVPPAPEPDSDCELVEGFHIGRRQAGEPKWVFVTVHLHETTQGQPGFAIEYRSFRHDGESRALDGGILDFDFVGTYRVRQWRYVTGGVYVTVEGCDHRNISVEFSA